MQQSRRVFLSALGAGVAFASLPEIPSVFGLFSSGPAADEEIGDTLRRLFHGVGAGGGSFAARAETVVKESDPQQLLGSPSALMGIFEQLGVDNSFGSRVGYDEAAQCRSNFESREQDWRERLGEGAVFTNVRRAPSDRDVAVLAGGKVNRANNTLYYAEGAVQYQQKPSVRLADHDPGVILAAPAVVQGHLRMSDKELAQAFVLTEAPASVAMGDSRSARRYETPVSSVIHIPYPRRNNRVGSRAVGVLAVSHRSDPGSIYFADLYE